MIQFIISLLVGPLFAYSCPSTLDSNAKAQQALQWLENHSGEFRLGACQVEITHCTRSQGTTQRSTLGEILMIDSDGREFYFNMRVPEKSVRKVTTKFKVNPNSLWVQQKNKYYEEESGRTEVWRFEMQSEWGESLHLKRIEMGVYTTNSQLNQLGAGNDSHWMICQ